MESVVILRIVGWVYGLSIIFLSRFNWGQTLAEGKLLWRLLME